MAKKKQQRLRRIQKTPQQWEQPHAIARFAARLNELRSAGDIRQDQIRSAPIELLPMV